MSIDKNAQKRSLRDRMTETLDLSTRTLSLFDKQFADYMQKLRVADDFSRKEALKLKPILKATSTLLAGSDYIGAAAKLASFYEILEMILTSFDVLTTHLTDERHQLLIDHLDDDTKRNIVKYFRRPKKASDDRDRLVKKADVLNWFAGKFNARRRALKSLEKRVPQLKELRTQIKTELTSAESLLEAVLKNFDQMSKARSKGDINGYHNHINDMNRAIAPVKIKFDKFYDTTVEPFIDYIEKKIGPKEEAKQEPKGEDRYKFTDEPASQTEEVTVPEEVLNPKVDRSTPVASGPIAPGPSHPTSGEQFETKAPTKLPFDQILRMTPTTAPAASGQFVNPHTYENKPAPAAAPSTPPPPESGTQKAEAPKKIKKQEPKSSGPKLGPDGKPLPLAPPGRAKAKADDGFAFDYSRASSHSQFITKLASIDENNLQALAQEILDYSETLEDSDPVASLKLLAIVEGLIEN